MAYEVVKKIGTRQYRYRVQSERDPHSGKYRNRWTYLGRVGPETEGAKVRAPRATTRLRLLKAAEGLLALGDANAMTVDAIVAAAGVAHGTFYRYFRDRSQALAELVAHARATRGLADEDHLRDDVATEAQARTAIRRWIFEKLRYAYEERASLRGWYALMAADPRLAVIREERREILTVRLREHLAALNARGFARVGDPAATVVALLALFDGLVRTSLLESDTLDAAVIAATADIVERAIFGSDA